MTVFKTKGPQIRCIPDENLGLSHCKSSCTVHMLVDKKPSRKAKINSKKQKVLKCVAVLPGHSSRVGWGLAQCKSNCEEHAGSDKSFENKTLFLDELPLKIQLTKEKRTLETLHGSVRGTQGLLFSVKYLFGGSKYSLEFSIAWGRLKICRWSFRSCTTFDAYLINSPRFSEVKLVSLA